ncbi:MAG: hypothetical protein A2Y12_13510 [Planctomycetes bacterium GWF2_42_9]|nr:MAG: hypothetical protein A2Y12_13510 [Planctomycetes bacterium GWF2_42_9]
METVAAKHVAKNSSSAGNLQKFLYSQIRNGQLKPGEKIRTAKLAKEWNVSEGTVNQSLHILAATGLLVRKRRAGTFVGDNSSLSSNVAETSNTIALLIPDLLSPEFSCLTQALQATVKELAYNVIALGAEHEISNYVHYIRDQIDNKVAGIILIPPLYGNIPTESLIELYNSKIPVVTCFRGLNGFGWPLVRTDTVYNTEIAVKHLCEIGRKNIGFVCLESPLDHYGLVKEHVFISTLDAYGLSSSSKMRIVLPKGRTPEKMWLFNAIAQIEKWLVSNPHIDAICCMHDMGAWAIISALAKMGKSVPEDIAIVGNGDLLQFFGVTNSDLTTVDMCYNKFGAAMLQMISDVRQGKTPEPEILIQGSLLVRHSTII